MCVCVRACVRVCMRGCVRVLRACVYGESVLTCRLHDVMHTTKTSLLMTVF